jgi:hypothetical protein
MSSPQQERTGRCNPHNDDDKSMAIPSQTQQHMLLTGFVADERATKIKKGRCNPHDDGKHGRSVTNPTTHASLWLCC